MVKIKKVLEISEDEIETLENAKEILKIIQEELGNEYLNDGFKYPDVLLEISNALDSIFY